MECVDTRMSETKRRSKVLLIARNNKFFLHAAVLLLLSLASMPTTLAFVPSTRIDYRHTFALFQSTDDASEPDFANEETLLKIHLKVPPSVEPRSALEAVSRYSQSFPFAAVLPVQPLMYVPAGDGVDVKFMRKKTDIKSGIDGGIRFFVRQLDKDGYALEVSAKRNSVGQSISKMVAERLVITSYVAGLTGKEPERFGHEAPIDLVQIESMYHKWM